MFVTKEGSNMADTVSRSWFAVMNNPEKVYNGSPEEILEKMKEEWIGDNPLKKGYWAYCLSKDNMPHVHMVLEASTASRFSKVKKAYPKAHLEPTKGSKKQVMDYIKKEPPFDEKGEQVICSTSYGNIEGFKRVTLSNMNETLHMIETLVEEGMTPNQIMAEDIRLRKEEALVRKAYFAKRYKETPPLREVTVIWHLGESGTGKSFSYVKLCEEVGEDNIFFYSDYANKGVGGFDMYCGEKVLFMDELKRGAIPYELLLMILQGYRTQIHCRYCNCYSLWNTVEITSIYPPEEIYKEMVEYENRERDSIKQLLRRITKYVYHYRENDEYKTFELEGSQYKNYEALKMLVTGKEGFETIDKASTPFGKE